MTAQSLATAADLAQLGLPSAVLTRADEKTAGTTARCLAAGNARAASALASAGYALPLAAWGLDLTLQVCAWSAFQILCVVGFNPDNLADVAAKLRYDAAEAWFQDVAAGRVAPSEIVDATPDEPDDAPTVATSCRRGW